MEWHCHPFAASSLLDGNSFLIVGLGAERFGLLTLIWAIVGYSGLFDLGLGRALTQMVAEQLGKSGDADIRGLVWTALWLLIGMGALGALILWVAAPSLVLVLQVPEYLSRESVIAFRMLAFGLPFVFVTSALAAVLEARQRFDVIATIRVPLGLLITIGPLFTVWVSPSLVWIGCLVLVVRVAGTVAFFHRLVVISPSLKDPRPPRPVLAQQLLSYGGWLTVSNMVGPFLTYLDRFFVGAILGAAAVAYYVTPYEVLSRYGLIPGVLLGVLFPAMTMAFAGDRSRAVALYKDATILLRYGMFALCCLTFLFAKELLLLWLGNEFSENSTLVARWLAVGVWVNVIAHTPLAYIQGTGRADLAARSHLAELIPYVALLVWGLEEYGIAGAAAVWTMRMLADTLVMNYWVYKLNGLLRVSVIADVLSLIGGLLLFGAAAVMEGVGGRAVFAVCVAILVMHRLRPYALRLRRQQE